MAIYFPASIGILKKQVLLTLDHPNCFSHGLRILIPSTLEKATGLGVYGTEIDGIGGSIRTFSSDFVVEEALTDGEIAKIDSTASAVEGKGNFLLCVLIKNGCDTFSALRRLSHQMRLSPKRISVGGLKDARALTAQHITLLHVELDQLRRLDSSQIRIVPLKFVDQPITANMVLGNYFTIRIRDLELPQDEVFNRVSNVVNVVQNMMGLPNFYGHQRFGTLRPITHLIGRCIVKRQFEDSVVEYITHSSPQDTFESKLAKNEFYETRDARRSLRHYPKDLIYERLMLEYLAKRNNDYVGALNRLPLRLRRLLVNAYQSFIFNQCLSERLICKLPLNSPCEGDYVTNLDTNGLPTGNPTMFDGRNLEHVEKSIREGRSALVFPVVGYDSQLSGGVQGDIEQKILNREGVKPRDFYIGPLHEASSSGKYRLAAVRVKEFSMRTHENVGDGKTELTMYFFLPRASYATILLREIMKPLDIVKAGF